MLSKVKTTAIGALALSVVSTNVNAAEVGVQKFVGAMVSQAVNMAAQEIHYGVQEAVLNTTHRISLNPEQAAKARTSIQDLAVRSNKEEAQKEQAE